MIANNEKPRWPFYLLWILLTMLCVPIAFFLNLIILRIITHFVGNSLKLRKTPENAQSPASRVYAMLAAACLLDT